MNIESILNHYVQCALWSSTDDQDEPLDAEHGIDDIAPATLAQMRSDVTAFVAANAKTLAQAGLDDGQIGHDFWLTRCGHGTGFWDRGLGELGDHLSTACEAHGNVDLYVGDDGKVYQ